MFAIRLEGGGGEYRLFTSFLAQKGISYRLSCPTTHQQNGVAERKHRHLIETTLTLLANASMPLSFWDEVVPTLAYNIDRLPSSVLNGLSPFQVLFQKQPDYSFFKKN